MAECKSEKRLILFLAYKEFVSALILLNITSFSPQGYIVKINKKDVLVPCSDACPITLSSMASNLHIISGFGKSIFWSPLWRGIYKHFLITLV